MARQAVLTDFHPRPAVDWDRMAARARSMRRAEAVALYAFLIAVSLPIILPYFWLVTIAFSARRRSAGANGPQRDPMSVISSTTTDDALKVRFPA